MISKEVGRNSRFLGLKNNSKRQATMISWRSITTAIISA